MELDDRSMQSSLNETAWPIEAVGVTLNWWQLTQLLLYSLIWVVGSLASIIVIYVILINPRLNPITNKYLLNLSIADLIFLQGIPFYLISLVNGQWPFSAPACKLFFSLTGVNQFTVIFFLTMLAYDRYLSVCHSTVVRQRHAASSTLSVIALWLFSIMCLSPVIIFSNVETIKFSIRADESKNQTGEIHEFRSCSILWPLGTWFGFVSFELVFILFGCAVSFVMPIILISSYYLKMLRKLNSNRTKVNQTSRQASQGGGGKRRVAILILVVIGIYLVGYTPYWLFQIYLLLQQFTSNENLMLSHQTTAHISSLLQLLVYLNSALNPFLYAFISEIFRTSLMDVLRCNRQVLAELFTCKRDRSESVDLRSIQRIRRLSSRQVI
nr:G protein-coupled receptor [Proales similis]